MGTMTAQEIKDKPEYQAMQQNKQTEEMYRQKWQGIFNNAQLCERYVNGNLAISSLMGTGSNDTIQVPEDPTERKVAQEVAQAVYSNPPKTSMTPEGQAMQSDDIKYMAAKKFLRACAKYTKKRNKQDKKELNRFQKENPGVGTYSQDQIAPRSDNPVDVFTAGCNAGKQAAYYYKASDQASQDQLAQQVQQFMQNKEYNVCFWYQFYSNINPQDSSALQEKQTRLNYLTPLYKQYENQAKPSTVSDKAAKTNAKQIYEDNARYGR